MSKLKQERTEAIAKLHDYIKPGNTVYTILRNVSRSGMSREIGVVVFCDGIALHPNYLVSKTIGARLGKRDGVIMSGCGMDMGFALVYELSHVLFPDGFECTGKDCNSNDHSNGDRNYSPHHHNDGGYALKQQWL